jgi:hypothetical protein
MLVALTAGVIAVTGCSSTTTTDGGTTEAGGGDGGGEAGVMCPTDLKCAAYCDFYTSTCSAQAGALDKATCNSLCKALTKTDTANQGMAGATSGDSIACREYHSCAASMTAANLPVHCPHASIWSGGDTCGTNCDAYCQIETTVCTGANAAFGGMNECLSKCGAWAATGKAGDTSGNTIQCREYHLGVASTSDANAMTHCPHTGDMSSTCM